MAWYHYINSNNSIESIRYGIFYHIFITPFGLGNLKKVLGQVESAGRELCEEENLIEFVMVPFSCKGSNPGPDFSLSASLKTRHPTIPFGSYLRENDPSRGIARRL